MSSLQANVNSAAHDASMASAAPPAGAAVPTFGALPARLDWLRGNPGAWRPGTLDVDGLHAQADELAARADQPERTRRLAREALALFDGSDLMRSVFHDVSVYMPTMSALALHHRPDLVGARQPQFGLTFTALYELLDRDDPQFGQPGHRYTRRAQLMQLLERLQAAGLFVTEVAEADGRVRVVTPTPVFNEIMQGWLRAFLRCALADGPAVGLASADAWAPDAPRWHGHQLPSVAWSRQTQTLRIAAWVHDRFSVSARFPLLRRLMALRHGYNAFLSLMEQLDVQRDGSAIVSMSLSRLAERFEVSRDTVRRVLDEMRVEISVPGPGSALSGEPFRYDAARGVATLAAPLVQTSQRWMALELLWMCGVAEAARRTLGPQPWVGTPSGQNVWGDAG